MVAKYFDIREFVSPAVYDKYKQNAWWFIDHGLIITADRLRLIFGPMTINDWMFGGSFRYRGLRSALDLDAPKGDFSQHRFGRAFDAHFKNATVREVREYILKNKDKFPYLGGLELDVNWLHCDTRNSSKLITFRG